MLLSEPRSAIIRERRSGSYSRPVPYANRLPEKVGSLRIVEKLIGTHQGVAGTPAWNRRSLEYLAIAERCVTSTLGLLLAWGASLWVVCGVSRRQPLPHNLLRRSASFFQGALIGLGVYSVVTVTLYYFGPDLLQYARLPVLATCPLLGGAAVLLFKRKQDTDTTFLCPTADTATAEVEEHAL